MRIDYNREEVNNMCGPSDTTKKEFASRCCTCGCGTGGGFRRRFWTAQEKKDCLDGYKAELTKELAALDECIQEGCC
jgi:hypothetical protein